MRSRQGLLGPSRAQVSLTGKALPCFDARHSHILVKEAGYLDSAAGASVKQTVTVSTAGIYQASAWVATFGSTGRITVRRNGSEAATVKLPKETKYQRYVLCGIAVNAGDAVEVAVLPANNGRVNVDDLAFQPDQAELRIASSNAKLLDRPSTTTRVAATPRSWERRSRPASLTCGRSLAPG